MRLKATPTDLAARQEFCAAVIHGARNLTPQQIRTLADRLHEMARERGRNSKPTAAPRAPRQDDRTVWI